MPITSKTLIRKKIIFKKKKNSNTCNEFKSFIFFMLSVKHAYSKTAPTLLKNWRLLDLWDKTRRDLPRAFPSRLYSSYSVMVWKGLIFTRTTIISSLTQTDRMWNLFNWFGEDVFRPEIPTIKKKHLNEQLRHCKSFCNGVSHHIWRLCVVVYSRCTNQKKTKKGI